MDKSRPVSLASSALLMAGFLTALGGSAAYGQVNCFSPGDGDLNGDGHPDVVVTGFNQAVDGQPDAGLVTIHFGGGKGSMSISQNTPGVPGTAEPGDFFGFRTAMYDTDGDECDDLVVSAPLEDVGTRRDAGAVWVVPGSLAGLDTTRASSFSQDSAGVPGTAEAYDGFGQAVAAFGTGDHGVLVIGSPGEDDNAAESGSVYVRRGGGSFRVVHQDSAGVAGHQEAGDRFGSAVAVSGEVFGVGVPGEDVGTAPDAGMVHAFRVVDSVSHFRAVTQATSGISGVAEARDRFGASIDLQVTRSVAEDGYDLAVGSPGETLGDTGSAHGAAYRIGFVDPRYNPQAALSQRFVAHQDRPEVAGVAEDDDQFGESVDLSAIPPGCDDCPAAVGMVVTSKEGHDAEQGEVQAIQAFGDTTEPGRADFWIRPGEYGLPADAEITRGHLRGYAFTLFIHGVDGRVYGLPWRNVVAGENNPVLVYGP